MDDAGALQRLHGRAFPSFFLTTLGPRFLELFYDRLIRDGEIVLVIELGGAMAGFAAGTARPHGFFTRLLRRDAWRFASASVPALVRHPRIAPRLWRATRRPAEERERPEGFATLLSIAVDPGRARHGLGARLLEAFIAEARARGAAGLDLTTDCDENDAVNAFYRRNGFSLRREFTTPEGRRMNEYEMRIDDARPSPPPKPAPGLIAKRGIDVVAASAGLATLLPLLVLVGAAVRLESPGPALFRQERVGLRGSRFRLLKFRTMCARSPGPQVTAAGDPRITRLGRFLRHYKLDELPQLINVLAGEMSLVGPRPEVPRYVQHYPERWRRALTVRPGLTDFAALEFLDEEAILSRSQDPERAYVEQVLPRKLELYERYLAEQSLTTDLRLIAETLRRIWR